MLCGVIGVICVCSWSVYVRVCWCDVTVCIVCSDLCDYSVCVWINVYEYVVCVGVCMFVSVVCVCL